jgi:hypothetical protein
MWYVLYRGNWNIFEDKVSIGVQSLAMMLTSLLLDILIVAQPIIAASPLSHLIIIIMSLFKLVKAPIS